LTLLFFATISTWALAVQTYSAWGQESLGRLPATKVMETAALQADSPPPPPQVQVLLRLDRNQDQLLEPQEIPVEVQSFVNSVIAEFEGRTVDPSDGESLKIDNNIDLKRLTTVSLSVATLDDVDRIPAEQPITPAVLRERATMLLNIYDKNRDGFLVESEWNQGSDAWKHLDFDSDGKLSIAEFQTHFQNDWTSDLQPRHAVTNLADADSASPNDVFLQLDANQDRQIQMHEFASNWTDEVVAEFYSRDRNRDGVITHAEWLHSHVANAAHDEFPPHGNKPFSK
jgi:Ca2+-binding EF-hand superfamily protein